LPGSREQKERLIMSDKSIEQVKTEFIETISDDYAPYLDINDDKSVIEFLQAVTRTCFNFILVNNKIEPGDRVPVNMKITEITDALSNDLIDYADFLDDYFRKAVE
jgi:hypothetical protein